MIRINEITDKLKNVVGWRQSYDPAKYIDGNLCNSESGLYFQDAHPLLTIDNVISTMPDDYGLVYPTWEASSSYTAGMKVRYNSKVWKAKKRSINQIPAAGSLYWDEYNKLNDYVRELTERAISAAVLKFIEIKQLDKETKTLLQRSKLFEGAGNIKNTLQNKHQIVGFEIMPARSMGVTIRLERLGLQFYGGDGGKYINVWLFHSSHGKNIGGGEFTYHGTNGSVDWINLTEDEYYLPTLANENGGSGCYYLAYCQDMLEDVDLEAINVSKDWSREPCGTCNMGSVELWREMNKYFQISPFKVAKPTNWDENDPALWDLSQMVYTNQQNYGLNLELSVGCDLTDFIIQEKSIFAPVIQKELAAIVLRTLALNPNVRVNRNQSNAAKMDILYELDGNTSGMREGGLGYELKKSYKALNLNTEALDRICLSCNNRGVRYRTI